MGGDGCTPVHSSNRQQQPNCDINGVVLCNGPYEPALCRMHACMHACMRVCRAVQQGRWADVEALVNLSRKFEAYRGLEYRYGIKQHKVYY